MDRNKAVETISVKWQLQITEENWKKLHKQHVIKDAMGEILEPDTELKANMKIHQYIEQIFRKISYISKETQYYERVKL